MKTIVITGATSGVGLTCVDHFLNKGWCVIGIARTLKGSKKHKNFHFIKADIKKYSDVKLAFDIIKKEFNKIDILINNASIFKTKQFIKFDNAEIDNILDTNVKGTMYCTLESIKLMTNESRIINLGSVSGLYGIKNQAVYSASKHAINGFAESLSQETNIKITTINPGGINTPLWNDNNPYNGNTSELLKTIDIVMLIDYITNLPINIILKNITIFPNCEWH